MEKLTIKKYIELYKIAVETVRNSSLIPPRSDKEIEGLISTRGRWLGFRGANIDKKELTNSTSPNVWMSCEEHLIRIGIHFNTIGAMRKAHYLLSNFNSEQKEELIVALKRLGGSYQTTLESKTYDKHPLQRPIYKEGIIKFTSNQIDDDKINELFNKAKEIEEEGKLKREIGTVKREYPVLNLLYLEMEDEAEFRKRIKEIFDVYSIIMYIEDEKAHSERMIRIWLEDFDKNNKAGGRWYYESSFKDDLFGEFKKVNQESDISFDEFKSILKKVYKQTSRK
jgi:hypothetical protein